MNYYEFSKMNRERCESSRGFSHKLSSWSTSDWFVAVMGELGEAANIAKKLNRCRDGVAGNKETAEQLRTKLLHEIGDTGVYLDLLAQSLGVNLFDLMRTVFARKSQELGYPDIQQKGDPVPLFHSRSDAPCPACGDIDGCHDKQGPTI